ncbi:MAG: papain-like cysteine protease family protein [Coriobacteriaceae bacterium]|nr:papain-like cysteine protease family protein [Coriobacteriaceae bacterium]
MQRQAAEEAARVEAAQEKKRLESMRVHPNKLGQQGVTVSTPKSQWRKGDMPHLYQTDPAWAALPYAGGDVRANACGPTCLSMVYVYLTGKQDLDPGKMSAFADANNYAPTGATEWRFMTEGAQSLGLNSSAIPVSRASITRALAAGQPVVCSVEPGDFTTVGHYIVLKSIDDRGMVEVFDPNSPLNSSKRWGIQRILNQTVVCWTFWM